MTDPTKRDLLSQVTGETRRTVLRSIGVGVGIGATVGTTSADTPDSYDQRTIPGQRDVGKNVSVTNDTADERTAIVRVRRQIPGKTNPTVFEREYTVPAPSDDPDRFPNVVHDDGPVQFGTPGEFVVEVTTDTGRTERVSFFNGTGRIDRNEAISVQLSERRLRLDVRRA
ncbi:MAG: hypothetical protein ABEI75_00945 [Halobaculum sp.]